MQVGYEQQFHSLSYEGSACIGDFANLLRLGVDPNIHDQVCYSINNYAVMTKFNFFSIEWLPSSNACKSLWQERFT